MHGITTSNPGNWAAALVGAAELPLKIARAFDGGVDLHHVAHAQPRAGLAWAGRGATSFEPATSGSVKLMSTQSRATGAATAHISGPSAGGTAVAAMASPKAKALSKAQGSQKKMAAMIYLRPRQQPGREAKATPAVADPTRLDALPDCGPRLAGEVAAHMRGQPRKGAEAYLAQLAAQQMHRGEADLARLARLLGNPAQEPENGGVRPEIALARQATEAWVLADYLRHGDGEAHQQLFISRLNQHVDGVLDTLAPEALWALYRRLTVDGAITVPGDASTLSGLAGNSFNAVGMTAARAAWAASKVCDLVGNPLSPQDLGMVLRNAVAAQHPEALHDETALASVAQDIIPLTMERCQYLLMRQLRVRAGEMLHEKGIPINELIGIATTLLPEAEYAVNLADTLRRTLTPGSDSRHGAAARYPSDEDIRQRLTAALDLFSDTEIRTAADNLFSDRVRHMKQLVQRQGTTPAEQAALGRQFTILCEMLADKLPQPLRLSSGGPALKALRGWDWDDRFSRDAHTPAPGRLARAGRAVFHGAQRLFYSVFPSARSVQDQVRDAYAQATQAASGFLDAVDQGSMLDTPTELHAARRAAKRAGLIKQPVAPSAWTPEALRRFNESGAQLMKAARRYDALCRSPAGKVARAELQLPANSFQLLEASFFDAMGKAPGARVNVLGRTVFDKEWLQGLHGLQEMVHSIHQAGPRPARSLLGRLFNRKQAPWQPPLGMAEAQALVFALQRSAASEAGVRASTEILHMLAQCCASAQAGASVAAPIEGSMVEDEPLSPDDIATLNGIRTSGGIQTPRDIQMLDDIRTLEQRFRTLEREPFLTPGQSGVDQSLRRFVDMGMKRLSPAERGRIEASVFNVDHRPPGWLAQDDIWQAIAQHCQGRREPRAGSGSMHGAAPATK